MSAEQMDRGCGQLELASAHVLRALPAEEAASFETHLAGCEACRREIDSLRAVVDSLVGWPIDVLRPSPLLWERLAGRIAHEAGEAKGDSAPAHRRLPDWEAVAPGISCTLLATDAGRDRVSMLVRLAPGAAYPAHRHSGLEELHLLDGELWIDGRKLRPGDHYRALAGTEDERVWSETGCTCVLVTSPSDVLR